MSDLTEFTFKNSLRFLIFKAIKIATIFLFTSQYWTKLNIAHKVIVYYESCGELFSWNKNLYLSWFWASWQCWNIQFLMVFFSYFMGKTKILYYKVPNNRVCRRFSKKFQKNVTRLLGTSEYLGVKNSRLNMYCCTQRQLEF